MIGRVLLLAAPLALTACTVGPDFHRPAYPLPPTFRGEGADARGPSSIGDLEWPRVFQDETLRELIRQAIESNYDLRVAAQRILQARAQVTVARSFQFPEVGASSSAQYSRVVGDISQQTQTKEVYAPIGGIDLSFEVDFWGRFRRATESARAELLASEEAQRFVVTSLVADVASAYCQLRAFDGELEVARQTLAARRDSLNLVQLRYKGGVAALIDVRQAEILVAGAAETIPETERLIEQTENVISTLLGHNPEAIPRGRPLGHQVAVSEAPAGSPAAMIDRRPDVRQAEAQLHAATARVGVAKSDFFPRVFLTGSAGVGGVMVNGSWFGPQGLFAAFIPSVILPIFNSGRIGAGVDTAEAQAEAAQLLYDQTVQQALREVSDGLVELRKRREFRIQQEALAEAARDAVRLSNVRYRGGVTSYLEVLDSDRQSFEADLGLVRSQRDEVLAVVRLYRALGGGWQ